MDDLKRQLLALFRANLGLSNAVCERLDALSRPAVENRVDTASGTIYLYGEIVSEEMRAWLKSWFDDDSAVSNQSFREDLKKITGDVTVRVMSGGGNVWEAAGIYGAMSERRTAGSKVTVIVDGLAASAASFISLASDEIVMQKMASMMMHRMSGNAWGTGDELVNYGNYMLKQEKQALELYVAKASSDRATIEKMLKTETWLTAEQALEHGLADRIIESPPPQAGGEETVNRVQNRIDRRFGMLRRQPQE